MLEIAWRVADKFWMSWRILAEEVGVVCGSWVANLIRWFRA